MWVWASIVCLLLFTAVEGQPASTNQIYVKAPLASGTLLPSIGNGYVSTFMQSSEIFVGGLFNGFLSVTPSHRAVIPSPLNYQLTLTTPSYSLQTTGYLFDLAGATFTQSSQVVDSSGTPVAWIDQTWLAHQTNRSLIMHTIQVDNQKNNVALQFTVDNGLNGAFHSPDISFSLVSHTSTGYLLYNGTTNQSETPNGPRHAVAVCTSDVSSTSDAHHLNVAAKQVLSTSYYTVFQTNIPGDSANPTTTAQSLWQEFAASDVKPLLQWHEEAWNVLWTQGGIEIEGTLDALPLQQVTNTSLYWLYSSMRLDWPWSLSPGSLASNGYNGHAFWDCETWMYPTIMMLNTSYANSLLQYRVNHAQGAMDKSKSYYPPYQGTMFPWEDAYSGFEVCPLSAPTGRYEQHITGDIAFAARKYWDNTHDIQWLNDTYPLIYNMSVFWASRVQWNGVQFVIDNIIPPDEYAVGVNNSVYTNVVAKMTLEFGIYASELLGHSYPPLWVTVIENIAIPFDTAKQYHPEYDGYSGQEIKQADVILLGFPLMYNMSKQVRANDLNFYSSVTDLAGPAMTWSMTAVGYIDLQQYDTAESYFVQGYANAQEPFQVWTETPTGGTVNFITGCGGFLQSVLFGYPTLRLHDEFIAFEKPILPQNVTAITLRNMDYRGGQLTIRYDDQSMSFTLNEEADVPLMIMSVNSLGSTLRPTLPSLWHDARAAPVPLSLGVPQSLPITTPIILYSQN